MSAGEPHEHMSTSSAYEVGVNGVNLSVIPQSCVSFSIRFFPLLRRQLQLTCCSRRFESTVSNLDRTIVTKTRVLRKL
jgi:hypothetical protein